MATFSSALNPVIWSNAVVPKNSCKCTGKSKEIERKAPLLLPCRTSFPCPRHFYKQLPMRKVGIWCGEWEENISFKEVRETGKGRSLGGVVANWSLGETRSVWKNKEYGAACD